MYRMRAIVNDHDDHCYRETGVDHDFRSEAENDVEWFKRSVNSVNHRAKIKAIWVEEVKENFDD